MIKLAPSTPNRNVFLLFFFNLATLFQNEVEIGIETVFLDII